MNILIKTFLFMEEISYVNMKNNVYNMNILVPCDLMHIIFKIIKTYSKKQFIITELVFSLPTNIM